MSLITRITRIIRPTKADTEIDTRTDTEVDFIPLDNMIHEIIKRIDPCRVSLTLQSVGNGAGGYFRIRKAIKMRHGAVINWTSEKYYSAHQALEHFSEESYALDI